jgi:hypothetical protein
MTPGEDSRDWSGARQADEQSRNLEIRETSGLPVVRQLLWDSIKENSRGEGLDTSFQERYARLSDEELLHIAGDRKDLREEAVLALDVEMARRGLTHQHARAKKRDELRMEIQEARAHHPKRNKSKYFVAQMNLRAYFICLIGLVLLMVLTHHDRVRDEWEWPLVVLYLGALIACLAVQPWVRRTLSFWFSLTISFVPQVVVAHWLAVHHPAHSSSGLKGSGFLSMLAGYALGGSVFVLLQKLSPGQDNKATQ